MFQEIYSKSLKSFRKESRFFGKSKKSRKKIPYVLSGHVLPPLSGKKMFYIFKFFIHEVQNSILAWGEGGGF